MKIRKKIMLGLWTVMLLAVTFTSTTYAWFKLNSHADIQFNFKVNGGLGFLVSVDNMNFSNDITYDKLLMAYYNKTHKDYTEWSNGKLIDSNTKEEISMDRLIEEFERIQLYPVTSNDGINFKDLYGSTFMPESRRYLEFDIYLKATSNNINDNFTYDIYLLYGDKETETGSTIKGTSITSDEDYIDISTGFADEVGKAGLYTWNKNAIYPNNQILVNSSNAMRFSISGYTITKEDIIENEEVVDTKTIYTENETANVYELTDDKDLGSYATNYSGDDIDLNYLYNANLNAMYTYYNTKRPNSTLKDKLMTYENRPKTLRNTDLANDENGNVNEKNPVVATVKSGGDSQKLTIRIWQEGWDADCFDGLAKSINVRLSLQSFIQD